MLVQDKCHKKMPISSLEDPTENTIIKIRLERFFKMPYHNNNNKQQIKRVVQRWIDSVIGQRFFYFCPAIRNKFKTSFFHLFWNSKSTWTTTVLIDHQTFVRFEKTEILKEKNKQIWLATWFLSWSITKWRWQHGREIQQDRGESERERKNKSKNNPRTEIEKAAIFSSLSFDRFVYSSFSSTRAFVCFFFFTLPVASHAARRVRVYF